MFRAAYKCTGHLDTSRAKNGKNYSAYRDINITYDFKHFLVSIMSNMNKQCTEGWTEKL